MTQLKNLKSKTLLEKLSLFKTYIQTDFTESCREEYGAHTFSHHIKPYVDDMLESFEAQLEMVAERTLLEEELSYDQNYQGE